MSALHRYGDRWVIGHPSNCSSLGNVLNVLVWSQVAVGSLWILASRWEARRGTPPPSPKSPSAAGEEPQKLPLEAHLQITSACPLPCPACHIAPTPDGDHGALPELRARLQALAAGGVRRVALGGGEALHSPWLSELVAEARSLGLTLGLTTSGVGLDEEKLTVLQNFSQVNVSLDGLGSTFLESRGYRGDQTALSALRALSARGIRCGINLVLSAISFPALETTVEAAIAAGAREIQVLRYKPVGRGEQQQRALTLEQARSVWPTLRGLIRRFPGVLWRGDCALVPFLADHDLEPARAAALGIVGCHGGEAFFSVDPSGVAHPCSFAKDTLGNLPGVLSSAPRWKTGVMAEPCGSCEWQSLCRGGCHAVAASRGEAFAADPECPRVLRWQAHHA